METQSRKSILLTSVFIFFVLAGQALAETWTVQGLAGVPMGYYNDIAVDSAGHVHLVYYADMDMTYVIWYATNASGKWEHLTVDTAAYAPMSIAVDGSNKVHISYFDGGLKYATNASGQWHTTTVATSYVSTDNDIAVDSQGHAYISCNKGSFPWAVYYFTNKTGSWIRYTIESSDDDAVSGTGSAIVIDESDDLHLAYGVIGDIRYATNKSGQWDIQTAGGIGSSAWYITPDIAVSESGHPYIVFCRWTYNPEGADSWALGYATQNFIGQWDVSILRSTGQTGICPSIAVATPGSVRICYRNESTNKIMYGRNGGGSWYFQTVADATDETTGIALDPGLGVHLSFCQHPGVITYARASAITPPAPSDVQVHRTYDQLHITWKDNAGNESGYQVQYFETPSLKPGWRTFAELGPNATSCQLNNPLYQHTYQFRVCAVNQYGCSPYAESDPITIYLLLQWIHLTSPDGGEEWDPHSSHNITWSSGTFGRPLFVDLAYSTDAGSNWTAIAEDIPNTGSYLWEVPDDYSEHCLAKVASANQKFYDLSNLEFKIPFPQVYMSFHIEDALEGVVVYKVAGDSDQGPTYYTRLDVVVKLLSYSNYISKDIPVKLTVPGDVLGQPQYTRTRNSSAGALSAIPFTNLGGGQYLVDVDLTPFTIWPGFTLFYYKQVVFRFLIPNDIAAGSIVLEANMNKNKVNLNKFGFLRMMAPGTVRAIYVTNRELLYDQYVHSHVNSLLQRMFTEAQGPPASHSPSGVIYYIERYSGLARNWDNTTVDYTSETTANQTANHIDDVIEDIHEDATQYITITLPFIGTFKLPIAWPTFLQIVGDDNIIPFYRYNDPSDDEGIDKISWCAHGWCVDSATNPAVHATDEDYLLTDNPYADLAGGSDWKTGDVELYIGRILGETAADMLSLFVEGVDNVNNGRTGGVVMASVDGWELGLEPDDGRAGEFADLYDVTALLRNKGFAVRNDDIPTSEVRTIDVMTYPTNWNQKFHDAANNTGGMDIFFIGGHDSYDYADIPGDDFSPDDTPGDYTRFGLDHPIAMIVGCHGGLPVPDIDLDGGADNCMVYDLIHEGARAYIGASGFSYGSPGYLHKCKWAELMMQDFFNYLMKPSGGNSMALGAALAKAKANYIFDYLGSGKDHLDRKTVTEFNLFGVPWSCVIYPSASSRAPLPASLMQNEDLIKGAVIRQTEKTYTQSFTIPIKKYEVKEERQGKIKYHLVTIPGGDSAVADDTPILPYVKGFTLPLPPEAEVLSVEVKKPAKPTDIGQYNVPIAQVEPWSEGGLTYTTKSSIQSLYPSVEELVQYQQTDEGLLFTVFPIRHNPSPLSKQTLFYPSFTVNVTYEAPITVGIVSFSTDKDEYNPGETVRTTDVISNVGDGEAVLEAMLQIKDAGRETLATLYSQPFTVPSGSLYTLNMSYAGSLDSGAYTAYLQVKSGKLPLGGASDAFTVKGSGILALDVPPRLYLGETGDCVLTFFNANEQDMQATFEMTLQDAVGGLTQSLPAQEVEVPAMSEKEVTFAWTPNLKGSGQWLANASVVMGQVRYGPISDFIEVHDCPYADLDGNCFVNFMDFAVFSRQWMVLQCSTIDWCEGADINHSGAVDIHDLRIMAEQWLAGKLP